MPALGELTLPTRSAARLRQSAHSLLPPAFSAARIDAWSVWGPAAAPVSCSMRPGAALKGRARGPSGSLFQMWSLASFDSRTALTVVMDWTKSWALVPTKSEEVRARNWDHPMSRLRARMRHADKCTARAQDYETTANRPTDQQQNSCPSTVLIRPHHITRWASKADSQEERSPCRGGGSP